MEPDGNSEMFEYRPDRTWTHFMTVPIGDLDDTSLLDFDETGSTLYMLDSRNRDRAALVAIDMATRQSNGAGLRTDVDIAPSRLRSEDAQPRGGPRNEGARALEGD